MKWWLVLALVLPFTQNPTKTPENQGATEPNRAQDAGHPKSGTANQQPPKPTPMAQPSPTASSKANTTDTNAEIDTNHKQAEDENLSIQRKLTWFTGLLVIIGFLQFCALIGQVSIYRRQAAFMAGSIHVDGVRVTELTEGQTPIFFVTVVNSGMTARQVSMTMAINILGEITKYQNSISMMVPAQGGERDFFIISSAILNSATMGKLSGDTLRVSGRITWGKGKKNASEYCYKYNPCPLAERPKEFPQFVPCDFNMGRDIDASITLGGLTFSGTLGTIHVPKTNTPENPNEGQPPNPATSRDSPPFG